MSTPLLKEVNASDLVSPQRLDIVVKYLYAKELYCGNLSNKIKSLYARHILMRTGGVEPPSAIASDPPPKKEFLQDYFDAFAKLMQSIKENGFDNKTPVPVSKINNLPLNGAHRIACSAALGQKIKVHFDERPGGAWDFTWFAEHGFSTEDIMYILSGFMKIHPDKTAIMVVWNPMFKHLDHIRKIVSTDFDIVGEVDLDFENNFIAFKNILLDIYEPNGSYINKSTFDTITAKADLLAAFQLTFKVIVIACKDSADIHQTLINTKTQIRDLFDHEIPKKVFATIHTSSNADEARYLGNILLSPNNIKQLKGRLGFRYNQDFINVCYCAKEAVLKLGLELDDAANIGSSVMIAYGIKEFADIDLIVKYKHRDKIGDAPIKNITANVDLCARGNKHALPLDDDYIIGNQDNYFYFCGLKFANLNIIKERKKLNMTDKNKRYLRQIDLYENYIGHIEQERVFSAFIKAELDRRTAISNLQPTTVNTQERKTVICSKPTQKKISKIAIKFLSCFIPKKSTRRQFRAKYSGKN
ncbi:MAG: hypothetical protein LBQ47_04655 [Endomicrobium sp.]|jgi:hypothetical protein|nr:hypothetical protein [Endomicrobium sp.]